MVKHCISPAVSRHLVRYWETATHLPEGRVQHCHLQPEERWSRGCSQPGAAVSIYTVTCDDETLIRLIVTDSHVCSSSADGTINAISGSAMSKDPFEPAKLLVTFFESKILWCRIWVVSEGIFGWAGLLSVLFLRTCRLSPCSLLGAVHRLRQLLPGVQLHRPRSAARGVRLDHEQRAHPVWGDPGGSAQHAGLHRSQCRQADRHQPGSSLLQAHGPLNRLEVTTQCTTMQ